MSNYNSSFLEHPLCKELNIGSVVLTGSVKKMRSFERRSAMDFMSKIRTDSLCGEEVGGFQPGKSTGLYEFTKNEPYYKYSRRPCLPIISPFLMHKYVENKSVSAHFHLQHGNPLSQGNHVGDGNSSFPSNFYVFHDPTMSRSLLPHEDLIAAIPTRNHDNLRNLFSECMKRSEIMRTQISRLERYEKCGESLFSSMECPGMNVHQNHSSSTVAFKKEAFADHPSLFTQQSPILQEPPSFMLTRTLSGHSKGADKITAITYNVSPYDLSQSEAVTTKRSKKKREISEDSTIAAVDRPNDVHDAAVLLASIRKLKIEKETCSPFSSITTKVPLLGIKSKGGINNKKYQQVQNNESVNGAGMESEAPILKLIPSLWSKHHIPTPTVIGGLICRRREEECRKRHLDKKCSTRMCFGKNCSEVEQDTTKHSSKLAKKVKTSHHSTD